MKQILKKTVETIFRKSGYEITKLGAKDPASRPVGRMDFLLEDLKMRGFKCQTIRAYRVLFI